MEFNEGDRVINEKFGSGVVVEKELFFGKIVYLVVFDNPSLQLFNFISKNLPANRCGRFYGDYLEKEVNDNV
jgi:hypothetical protein